MDVSVIIPTYNRAEWVGESVESALRQKGVDVEILVVDDGSTDDTADRLATAFEGRIHYIRQENAGACAARNRGMELSTGRYLKFLDADDCLEPDSLAAQVQMLDSTGAAITYGFWEEFGGTKKPEAPPSRIMPGTDPIDALLEDWWCVPCAYLIRRDCALKARWDSSLTSAQDFDYILQLAMKGAGFVLTPRLVGYYRQHEGQRVSRRALDVWVDNREGVLVKAQTQLRLSETLTPNRACLIARELFHLAQVAFSYSRPRFRELLKRALETDSDFLPRNPIHAMLIRMIGFERSEALLEVRRRWRKSR